MQSCQTFLALKITKIQEIYIQDCCQEELNLYVIAINCVEICKGGVLFCSASTIVTYIKRLVDKSGLLSSVFFHHKTADKNEEIIFAQMFYYLKLSVFLTLSHGPILLLCMFKPKKKCICNVPLMFQIFGVHNDEQSWNRLTKVTQV